MMVVGSMVGAGIWSLPRPFATATGVFGAIIAWLIAAGGMYTLARVFQALAERKPDLDAGVYAYEQPWLSPRNASDPMRCLPPMASQENGFALSTGFLPSPVDPRPERNNAAPSLQLHYRTFITTTSCPAPVPRIGTLVLMGATHLDFSLRIEATGSHVPCKSPVQSSRRLHAGCRLGRNQGTPRLVPG